MAIGEDWLGSDPEVLILTSAEFVCVNGSKRGTPSCSVPREALLLKEGIER